MSIVGKPIVLILCTGNSCRSQMAEGFLRHFQSDKFEPHSAGTEPQPRVHPLAIKVMAEVGIDLSGQRPKNLGEYLGRAPVRHLLIVCDKANGTCPRIWPGAYTRAYMPFDDPPRLAKGAKDDDEAMVHYRLVRDEIRRWVETLPESLSNGR